MNKKGILMLAAFLALGFLSLAQEVQTPSQTALSLFSESSDVMIPYSFEGRTQLEAAIDEIKSILQVPEDLDDTNEASVMALQITPEQSHLVYKLSQAYYTLGDVFYHEKDGAKEIFTKGQYWGLKGLRNDSDFLAIEGAEGDKDEQFIKAVEEETRIAPLYWTYANWARKDELDIAWAIARNDPPKLLALAERTLEVDETYIAYGPYRSLAAFWGGLTSLPIPVWHQDLPKALYYICPVVDAPACCSDCADCPRDPDHAAYFENRLIFAEFYLMEKREWQAAADVLQSIIDDEAGDTYPLYNAYCQELAADLLQEVNKHL